MSACAVLESPSSPEIIDLRPQLRRQTREFIVADLFCGLGGFTEGLKRAAAKRGLTWTGVCVNHWDKAVLSHEANHPNMRHVLSGVELTDPKTLCPWGYLDLLIAGVSCTHHSNARGAMPVNDQLRSGGWQIVRWCQVLDVRNILIENVPEFLSWGPTKDGKAIKERKGEYFRRFVRELEKLGYKVAWKVQMAADFGTPQTRRRLIISATKDKQYFWPEPSHVDPKVRSKDKLGLFADRKLWVSARDGVIDWSRKGRSIFDSKKPLAAKTLTRIYLGLARYGGPNAPIFLLVLAQYMHDRGIKIPQVKPRKGEKLESFVTTLRSNDPSRSADGPLTTVTAGGTHHMLCEAVIQYNGASTAHSTGEPINTVTARDRFALAQGKILFSYHGGEQLDRARPDTEPSPTVDCANRIGVVEVIVGRGGSEYAGKPKPATDPIGTVTADDHHALAESILVTIDQHGSNGSCARPVDVPSSTVTTKARDILAQPSLINLKGQSTARSVDDQSFTQTTSMHQYLAEPLALPHRVFRIDDCDPIDAPYRTIRAESGRQNGVVWSVLVPHWNERDGQEPRVHSVDYPSPTVTGRGGSQLAEGFLFDANHGSKAGDSEDRRAQPVEDPIGTVTGSLGKGIAQPLIVQYNGFGEEPFAILWVDDVAYAIDIHIRMLEPEELQRAQDLQGMTVVGTKKDKVKQIGNAIPAELAESHIGSVLDHWAGWEYVTEVAA